MPSTRRFRNTAGNVGFMVSVLSIHSVTQHKTLPKQACLTSICPYLIPASRTVHCPLSFSVTRLCTVATGALSYASSHVTLSSLDTLATGVLVKSTSIRTPDNGLSGLHTSPVSLPSRDTLAKGTLSALFSLSRVLLFYC